MVATAAALGFSFYSGHPWLSAPATAILICFWCNSLAASTDRWDYFILGWWSLLSGIAGLFFVEGAPFLWLFIIYGGLCCIFAAETLVASILKRRRANEKRG
jgi:urea transporter